MSKIKKSPIRACFNNKAQSYNKVAVLQEEIAKRLLEHLNFLKPNTQTIVDLGAGTGLFTQLLVHKFNNNQVFALDIAEQSLQINLAKNSNIHSICAQASALPFMDKSIDLITSNLMLQWCEKPRDIFKEISRVLKPNGLFIFSSFGVETLLELKRSWAFIDDKQHVNNFVDMHSLGDDLLHFGLQNPVMDMEKITLTYEKVTDLMQDLKDLGANYVYGKSKGLMGKNKFNAMSMQYDTFRVNGKLPATYEVIYGHAWQSSPSFKHIDIDGIIDK